MTVKLSIFTRTPPARVIIRQLDDVLEAVWRWEQSEHGYHAQKYQGRAVYEAVIELQEYVFTGR